MVSKLYGNKLHTNGEKKIQKKQQKNKVAIEMKLC